MLITLFYALIHTPHSTGRFFESYLSVLASLIGAVLNLFGAGVTVTGTRVFSDHFAMEIVRGCDAIEPVAVFAAAVLASPVVVSRKLSGIFVGAAALLLINLLRLVSLFFVGAYYRKMFDVLHESVWQAAFVLLALVFWAIWVQWATRSPHEQSNVSS